MPTTKRSRSRKSKWSWWHLIAVLTGGGAGIGGWQGWDYLPNLQDVLQKVANVSPGIRTDAQAVAGRLNKERGGGGPRDSSQGVYSRSGTFTVRIKEVRLDPSLFKGGHTVDIQAKVTKHGVDGKDSEPWESKPFGTRLAVVGRDELITGWPNSPFDLVWTPGDRFIIEVFDRKAFFDSKSFLMEQAADPNLVFPLQSGPHTLTLVERNRSSNDPSASRIILETVPKNHERPNNTLANNDDDNGSTAEPKPPHHQTQRAVNTKSEADANANRQVEARQTASNSNGSRVITDRNIQIR